MLAGSLEIELMTGIARLQKDMRTAQTVVGGAMSNIDRSVGNTSRAVDSLRNAMRAMVGGFGVAQLIGLVDAYTKYTAQLKLATRSTQEYAAGLADVRRIAAASQSDIGAVTVLYSRLANNLRDAGVGQAQVAKISETVALALKVQGATTGEAASAMQQLSQAFGKGKLDGDEFRTVMEATPNLMRRVADALGVPFGALKELAEQGKITGEKLARALSDQKYLDELRRQAVDVRTISGAFVDLKNKIVDFVGAQAQASGVVSALTGAIGALANNLNLLATAAIAYGTVKLSSMFLKEAKEIYLKVAAQAASVAATAADRAATIAATAAEVERARATMATIAAERVGAVARMQAAQATIAATAAEAARAAVVTTNAVKEVAQVQAVGMTWRQFTAERMSEYMRTEGGHAGAMRRMGAEWQIYKATATAAVGQVAAAVTASAAQQTAVTVASTRLQTAAVTANTAARAVNSAEMSTMAALGTLQAAATAKMTAAQLAHNAALKSGGVLAAGARGALGLLGGPIGVISLLLGLGVTAWMMWGRASEDANKQAQDSTETSGREILASLEAQNAKLRERLDLAKAGNVDAAKTGGADVERLAGILKEINTLKAKGTSLTGVEQLRLIELRSDYEKISTALKTNKQLTGEIAAQSDQAKAKDWLAKYATSAEKLNAELAKAKKELGSAFTPEIEKRIRDAFGKKEIKDFNKELEEQAKLVAELGGLTGSFAEDWARLSRMYADGKGVITLRQLEQEQAKLLAQQPAIKAAADARIKLLKSEAEAQAEVAKEIADAYVAESKAREQAQLAVMAYAKGVDETQDQLKLELSLVGATEAARKRALALYKIELDLKQQIAKIEDYRTGFDEAQREEQRAKARTAAAQARANVELQAEIDVADKVQKEWEATNKQIGDSFVDNLMRGGKSVAQYLKDLFRTLVLRPMLAPVGQAMSGMVGNAMGAVPGGNMLSSGMGNLFGGGGNMVSTAANALGFTNFAAGMSGVGGSFASTIGAGLATDAMGATVIADAAAASLGTVGAAAGSAFASIAAVAGPLAIAAIAIMALSKGGETRSGGVYENGNFVTGPSGGEIGGDQVRQTIGVTMASINDTLKALGSSATLQGFVSGLEQSEKGKGFAFAGGRLSTGAAFGQGTDGLGYQNRRGSMTNEQASAAFAEELKQATLQALQAADVPGQLGDYLRQLGDIDALSGGALDAALARINKALTEKQSLEEQLYNLTHTELEILNRARDKERAAIDESNLALLEQVYAQQDLQAAAEKFTARMQSIASKVDSVIQEFLSPEGYRQYTAQKLQQGLAAVGINASIDQIFSATKEQYAGLFRQLMDAGNLEAAEAVADLASTFLQLQPAADTATESINRMAQSLQDAGKGIAMYLRELIATRAGTATPEAGLSGLRGNYLQDLGLARGGDLDANNRIAQSAQAYIEAQKGYSASGGMTQAVISQVIAELQALPAVKSYEAQSLDALGGIIEALNDLPDSLSPTLAQAFAEKFEQIDLNGDGITFDEMQAALAGKATDEQLRIMFTGLDANGDGTISRLEALAGKADVGNLTSQQVLNRLMQDSLLSYPAAIAGAAFKGIVDNTYLTQYYLADMLALMRGGASLASGATGGGAVTGTSSGSVLTGGGSTSVTSGTVTDEAAFNAALDTWAATQTVMASSDPMAVYGAALSSGLTLSDVDALRGWPAGTSASWADAQGLPSFGGGGDHAGGARLVGEFGPEIEVTGPSRIYSASDTRNMLGGGDNREVVAELQDLKRTIAELLSRQITLEAQIGSKGIEAQERTAANTDRIADKAELAGARP